MSGIGDSPLGCVPIVWNNADQHDLAPETPAATVMDEIARLGFAGTQHGRGFPEGDVLRRALAERGLRFAELYSALDADANGLARSAADIARRDLGRLVAAGGEVLVVAVEGGGERDQWAARVADGAPRWPAGAFDELAQLLAELAAAAPDGTKVAFHPHGGTWVEDPDDVAALAERLPGTGAGLCLDVGHYLVGGGDPVEAIGRYGELVTHVHVKDVDPDVLGRLRAGELPTLSAAIRERIFTEAGNGLLDLDGVLRALDRIGYGGWLMVEQDSTWLAPSEAAAIGKRVVEYARRAVVRAAVA
jgi:inosose dehydratase